MKQIFLAIALSLPMLANAQVLSGSNSDSSSSSQSASGAMSNNANNVNIISSAPELQRHESSSTSHLTENVNVTGQQHFKTNTAVALAAAVSFSSDYCGGTASGGASAAGITIGASKPLMDVNCQKLRRAEKLGMSAVSAYNMGMKSAAAKLQYMSIWQLCTIDQQAQEACLELGLITEKHLPNSEQPTPVLP